MARISKGRHGRKGSFKRALESLPKQVDFFGEKWTNAMGRFLDALPIAEEEIRGVVVALFQGLFDRIHDATPVRTGHARSGWRIIVERDDAERYDALIVNGVSYIVWLELGWSKRRPEGMVRVSLYQFAQELRSNLARAA